MKMFQKKRSSKKVYSHRNMKGQVSEKVIFRESLFAQEYEVTGVGKCDRQRGFIRIGI